MVHTTNEYCFSGNNFIKLTAIRKAGTLVNTGGKKISSVRKKVHLLIDYASFTSTIPKPNKKLAHFV